MDEKFVSLTMIDVRHLLHAALRDLGLAIADVIRIVLAELFSGITFVGNRLLP